MDRTILHCDLNGFYASVECLSRPELKDVPMAVSGNPENRHGIILAKNELAKKHGIVTAESVWQAKKKCPDLVLVPPHHDKYYEYSKLVNDIYEKFTDMVEPFGIDESWLDVTGSLHLFGNGKNIADKIRETVKRELGLTLSVGVSFNKIFAKLGSDYKKPDATTVISRDNYKDIIYPLPVSDLLYVGKAATETLAKFYITTIGQLAKYDRTVISAKLGKMGAMIHDYANGIDESPVGFAHETQEAKSVGNGMTFKRDLIGLVDITAGVMALSDTVATRLRKTGLKCSTVQVVILNPQFKTISRQKKLTKPTHLSREMRDTAIDIIKAAWNLKSPIRMLTITGMNLVTENESEQVSFFSDEDDKQRDRMEKIELAVDTIRSKYGQGSISLGSSVNNDIGKSELKSTDDQ
jgi:DNA polymerase IV